MRPVIYAISSTYHDYSSAKENEKIIEDHTHANGNFQHDSGLYDGLYATLLLFKYYRTCIQTGVKLEGFPRISDPAPVV